RGFFDRGGPVSSRAAFLTAAERHLVQAHRCEVAWLLRQLCLSALLEGPRHKLYCRQVATKDWQIKYESPSRVRQHISAVQNQEDSVASETTASALALLSDFEVPGSAQQFSVQDLAEVAFRLEPTAGHRILAAMGMSHGNSPDAAIRILNNVLSTPL